MGKNSELGLMDYRRKKLKKCGFKFDWEGGLKEKTSSVRLQHRIKKMISNVLD